MLASSRPCSLAHFAAWSVPCLRCAVVPRRVRHVGSSLSACRRSLPAHRPAAAPARPAAPTPAHHARRPACRDIEDQGRCCPRSGARRRPVTTLAMVSALDTSAALQCSRNSRRCTLTGSRIRAVVRAASTTLARYRRGLVVIQRLEPRLERQGQQEPGQDLHTGLEHPQLLQQLHPVAVQSARRRDCVPWAVRLRSAPLADSFGCGTPALDRTIAASTWVNGRAACGSYTST